MTPNLPQDTPRESELVRDLQERTKELRCLFRVSEILNDEHQSVDDKMNAIVECLPSGWQHTSIAAARIRIDNRVFHGGGWRKARHRLVRALRIADQVVGDVELIYTANPPGEPAKVFLREEELLLCDVARRLITFLTIQWKRQRLVYLEAKNHPSAEGHPDSPVSKGPQGLVGDSEAMQTVYRAITRVCQTNAAVLIHGESGTGKELVARAIHYDSERSDGPFVPVNCAAIPDSLVESELFGSVKGAYTGAHSARAGFFQTAEGGTLFLDEVGEMNAAIQAKLLRVLQDHEVRMVGSDKARTVDVRVVAATNKDLSVLVESGRFRADLFFRLSVIVITLPPLRERGRDLAPLMNYFVEKWKRMKGDPPLSFSDRALRALESYAWPGNIRELENLIQRLSIMAEDAYIDIDDLPDAMRYKHVQQGDVLRPLREIEVEHVQRVLNAVEGNVSRAARVLEIDRKTLRKKLDIRADTNKDDASPPTSV